MKNERSTSLGIGRTPPFLDAGNHGYHPVTGEHLSDAHAGLPPLPQGEFDRQGINRERLMSLESPDCNKGAREAQRQFNSGRIAWSPPPGLGRS
jgi:hypothetical protein